jgi:hypothetical protein
MTQTAAKHRSSVLTTLRWLRHLDHVKLKPLTSGEQMRIEPSVIKTLDIAAATQQQLKRGSDRFPPLIIDRCLQDASEMLERYIPAIFLTVQRT